MVYIFLAEGFEEIEALTQIDLLKRVGIEIKSVGIGGGIITGAHGIPVICDMTMDDFSDNTPELIILPGGMPGVTNLYGCEKLLSVVENSFKKGLFIAAICAAPLILGRLGISEGKNMVCYPGFEDELKGATIKDVPVVRDGNIITAKAAGSAILFAHEIISALSGNIPADKVLDGIYYDR